MILRKLSPQQAQLLEKEVIPQPHSSTAYRWTRVNPLEHFV